MENETNSKVASRFSGSVLIALLTGAAYLAAFSYESSYLSHFGISNDLVQISVETLIRSLSAVTIFFVFTVWYWNILIALCAGAIENPDTVYKRVIVIHLAIACLGIMLGRSWGFSWNGLLIFVCFVIIFDIVVIAVAWGVSRLQEVVFRRYQKKHPEEAKQLAKDRDRESGYVASFEDLLKKWIGPEPWILVIGFFLVSSVGMLAAKSSARQTKTFSALVNKHVVLIRKHGDFYVCKTYTEDPPLLERGTVILRLEDMVGEKIGTVTFADPPEVECKVVTADQVKESSPGAETSKEDASAPTSELPTSTSPKEGATEPPSETPSSEVGLDI